MASAHATDSGTSNDRVGISPALKRRKSAKALDTRQYVTVESAPMNLAMARALAETRDFADVLPWTAQHSCTVLDFVDLYSRRAVIERGAHHFTTDYYRESELSDVLGHPQRLITGYQLAADAEPPPSIALEIANRVPPALLGWSVLQGPKILRHLFFVDVLPPLWMASISSFCTHTHTHTRGGFLCQALSMGG